MANRQKSSPSSLTIKGELTVKYAETLKKKLLASLQQNDLVEILLEDISRVDIACLQLFCSAHRYAAENGKTFHLVDRDNTLLPSLRTSGFISGCNCHINELHSCIWSEIENA